MKTIEPTQTNEKIITDVIALKIKKELDKKKTFAQDLIDSIDTEVKYN